MLSVVVILGALYYKLIKKPVVINTPATTQQEDVAAIEAGNSPKNPDAQTASSTKDSGQSQSSGAGPITPSGNFVSNHKPSSKSDNLESVCRTSVGASCKISFTRDGVVKNLDAKPTNQDGVASWIWSPTSIGLTSGSWQIAATAEYNGRTADQPDPLNLEIP